MVLNAKWNQSTFSGGGFLVTGTTEILVNWGDGTTRRYGLNIDRDGDGINDAIQTSHVYDADGQFSVQVFNQDNIGDGEQLSAAIFSRSVQDRRWNAGPFDDLVLGGSGEDSIRTGNDDDLVDGGSGDDRIDLSFENDIGFGSAGDDGIRGGRGLDSLYGGEGNDALLGEQEDDALFGNAGSDRLRGGDGSDALSGGAGADHLLGGSGADEFVFATGDSTVANYDLIRDFVRQQGDSIDLSAFAGDLTFLGTGAFTGAGNEVRYAIVGSNTGVVVDLNGDQRPDCLIALSGNINLQASDFVL